jgi:hypothetical protein
MGIIKLFENFEEENLEQLDLQEKDKLIGDLLHLYGSIPVPKEKSSIVIKKIVIDTEGEFYKLGENITPGSKKPHDKVRFADYFDSLLSSKDIRGHNFEGCLCGLYGGDLNKRGGRWDITIGDKNYSVKFVDGPGERVQLGSYKSYLSSYSEQIENLGGLGKLFRIRNSRLKKNIWKKIVGSSPDRPSEIDGWIIAYPVGITGHYTSIICHLIDFNTMTNMILNEDMTVAPKQGWSDHYSLAVSSQYKNKGIKFEINLPTLTLEELRIISLMDHEQSFSKKVFKDFSYKIRPDVLRYIYKNRDKIVKRISEFDKKM